MPCPQWAKPSFLVPLEIYYFRMKSYVFQSRMLVKSRHSWEWQTHYANDFLVLRSHSLFDEEQSGKKAGDKVEKLKKGMGKVSDIWDFNFVFYLRIVSGKIEFYPAHTQTTWINLLPGWRGCERFVPIPKSRKGTGRKEKESKWKKRLGGGEKGVTHILKKIKSFPKRGDQDW